MIKCTTLWMKVKCLQRGEVDNQTTQSESGSANATRNGWDTRALLKSSKILFNMVHLCLLAVQMLWYILVYWNDLIPPTTHMAVKPVLFSSFSWHANHEMMQHPENKENPHLGFLLELWKFGSGSQNIHAMHIASATLQSKTSSQAMTNI